MQKLITVLSVLVCACQAKKNIDYNEKHLISIESADKRQMLFVDTISTERMIKKVDTAGSRTFFSAYKITIIRQPSLPLKKAGPDNQYYQYQMYRDWKGITGADTLLPVYYYPEAGNPENRISGVLVFELPKGKHLQSLNFRDPDGIWMNKKLTL